MLSKRVMLSPLVQSAMRPGWGQGFIEPREHPTPVKRDHEFVVVGPDCQRMPTVRSNIRIDAYDLLGRAVAHEREQNSIPQRIQLDEILVLWCSQSHGDPAALI